MRDVFMVKEKLAVKLEDCYISEPYNQVDPGIYLLQINPAVFINLNHGSDYGFLLKHKDVSVGLKNMSGKYEKIKKLDPDEISHAYDQISDLIIIDAKKLKLYNESPSKLNNFNSLIKKAINSVGLVYYKLSRKM